MQGTHRAPSLAKLPEREHGSSPPHVDRGRLLASPPDERQIAHQVPDPTEALVLMVSAIRALLCTTHLLDKAVRAARRALHLSSEHTKLERQFLQDLPRAQLVQPAWEGG